jgi:hypothetical protein
MGVSFRFCSASNVKHDPIHRRLENTSVENSRGSTKIPFLWLRIQHLMTHTCLIEVVRDSETWSTSRVFSSSLSRTPPQRFQVCRCDRFGTTPECSVPVTKSKLGKIDTTPSREEQQAYLCSKPYNSDYFHQHTRSIREIFEIQLRVLFFAPKWTRSWTPTRRQQYGICSSGTATTKS